MQRAQSVLTRSRSYRRRLLCAGFSLVSALAAHASHHLSVSDFSSAESCADCHSEIYQQWQSSAHSRAAKDVIFQKILPQAARDLGNLGVGFCLKCHAPVATVAKEIQLYSKVSLPLKLNPVSMEGVTCDFCHTISGKENFGKDISPGIYVYPRKGETAIKFGVHADAVTTNHLTATSSFLKSSEFCGICHKFSHPFTGETLQDTYSEWRYGPYAGQGGKLCQDCHMPEYGGYGAIGAFERTNLHAHVFPGGRSDLVKKVASVTVLASLKKSPGQDKVNFKALVTNVGSGHLMPTGLPGLRQMWVAIEIHDAAGTQVFTNRDPIGIEGIDANGNLTMPWNAVRFGKDTRIGPKATRQVSWTYLLPKQTQYPLETKVAVYYRSISPLAAQAAGIEPSPPIEIATDRLRLLPDGQIERVPMDGSRAYSDSKRSL